MHCMRVPCGGLCAPPLIGALQRMAVAEGRAQLALRGCL